MTPACQCEVQLRKMSRDRGFSVMSCASIGVKLRLCSCVTAEFFSQPWIKKCIKFSDKDLSWGGGNKEEQIEFVVAAHDLSFNGLKLYHRLRFILRQIFFHHLPRNCHPLFSAGRIERILLIVPTDIKDFILVLLLRADVRCCVRGVAGGFSELVVSGWTAVVSHYLRC